MPVHLLREPAEQRGKPPLRDLGLAASAVRCGVRYEIDMKSDPLPFAMKALGNEAVDDIRAALEGMLAPEKKETVTGAAEVREVFKISKVGTIAGCYVSEGKIDRKGRARVIRDGIVIYDGDLSSLKRFKDDAKEVREGYECGIGIHNFNDVKVSDVIECYVVEEVARTLAGAN